MSSTQPYRQATKIDSRLKSPFKWLTYIGHAVCATGLTMSYAMTFNNGDTNTATWNEHMRFRRMLLGSGITLGVLSALGHAQEAMNAQIIDPAEKQYPLLWLPRILHMVIPTFVLIGVEYKGPQYSKLALLAIVSAVITNKLAQRFYDFYVQSMIQELDDT